MILLLHLVGDVLGRWGHRLEVQRGEGRGLLLDLVWAPSEKDGG